MKTITIARDVAVGGKHQAEGTVLTVGTDVSKTDAEALVNMRAATEGGEVKPKRERKTSDKPSRAELDEALGKLPGDYKDPDYVVAQMRGHFGAIFTDADEAKVRELVKTEAAS